MSKQTFETWLDSKEVAKIMGVSLKTVENWRKEGILIPIKGIPSIKFSPAYIRELEGVQMDLFSPLERKKMQIEIESLKKQLKELKQKVRNVTGGFMQIKEVWEEDCD